VKSPIPRKTVYRLSLYNRCLERFDLSQGRTVSSDALAKVAGVKPTQLRKDLAHCGQFGKRGLGYDITMLRKKLTDTLGTTGLQPVVLVGAGNLGSALLRYQDGFAKEGFVIAAAFDLKPQRRSRDVSVPILPMADLARFVSDHHVKMAILCVPALVAQEVCNTLVAAGIQAILNFAPLILQTPREVAVNNVNLAIELENLSYFTR
jgi:redox-sensing transcriptional repressor